MNIKNECSNATEAEGSLLEANGISCAAFPCQSHPVNQSTLQHIIKPLEDDELKC
jgi:hypothetical protein